MNSFSVLVAFGAALGLVNIQVNAPARQASRWVDAAIWVLLAALIGARLGFVAQSAAYFQSHPLEILQFSLGGLTWPGAVLGALLALIGLRLAWQISPGRLADGLSPLLPPLSVLIWLGAWQSGSACGVALPAGTWWGVPCQDISGTVSTHWPVQPLAAFSLLVAFTLLHRFHPHQARPGQTASLVALVLALNLFLFSFLVPGQAPLQYGLRFDSWAAAALAGLSALGFLAAFLYPRKRLPAP